jgi:hypothetical protein
MTVTVTGRATATNVEDELPPPFCTVTKAVAVDGGALIVIVKPLPPLLETVTKP